jgi:hypothetical protein
MNLDSNDRQHIPRPPGKSFRSQSSTQLALHLERYLHAPPLDEENEWKNIWDGIINTNEDTRSRSRISSSNSPSIPTSNSISTSSSTTKSNQKRSYTRTKQNKTKQNKQKQMNKIKSNTKNMNSLVTIRIVSMMMHN